ncbi:MAG: DUF3298 and DUF4163 domain-containing protein [Clostridiales bacterium]|nr:DUF3298 and DUF4163 domain-containing protein [Clostridiales bacterium]
MKLKYLILPLILTVSSCAMSNEAAKINIVQKDYETEYSQVNAQLLQFDEIGSPEYTESLNQELSAEFDAALSGFDADALENKDVMQAGNKSVFESTQTVKYNKNDFVSVLEEVYTYNGGAHGTTLRRGRNFDVASESQPKLSELFGEEGWEEMLNNYMAKLVKERPDEYNQLWEQPAVKSEQDYYITDTDLVLFYQPYELSYYARGFVEFPIRLSDIRGFLKEEYYRLVPEE